MIGGLPIQQVNDEDDGIPVTGPYVEAIILLASVKLLNGNEALSGEVGSFLKEIQVQITLMT